jgi:hypothetical protein
MRFGRNIEPARKIIFAQEAAFVIVRAMSKFAAVYNGLMS